jgi:hypothetical protein
MKSKIEKAIEVLKQQGHTVRPYNREGTFWFEIDGRMLASAQEMGELADRVYSVTELEDLFTKRRAEEQRKN